MLCVNTSNIGIMTVKGIDYRFIIHGISKFEGIHLLKSSMLDNHVYM